MGQAIYRRSTSVTERKLVFTELALKTPTMGSTWLANARCMEAVPIFRPAVDIPTSTSVFRTEVGEFTEVARRAVTRFENKARHCWFVHRGVLRISARDAYPGSAKRVRVPRNRALWLTRVRVFASPGELKLMHPF